MPRWFPDAPDHEFLNFAEVCEVLPVDAQKYLVRGNRLLADLEPWAVFASESGGRPCKLWQLDGTQDLYEFQKSLRRRLGSVRDTDLDLLHEQSQVIVDGQPVALWWRRQDVKDFLESWEPMRHLAEGTDPLPWESVPVGPGRPGEEWHDQIAGAADFEEAVNRLPALPNGTERTFKDATGTPMVRISQASEVTRKHFLKMLREGRLKSDKE